jgi:hypothetical protein
MYRRLFAWLRLLAAGAVLYAGSSSGCMANTLRDMADEIEGSPQTLDDVDTIGDFFGWLDGQVNND